MTGIMREVNATIRFTPPIIINPAIIATITPVKILLIPKVFLNDSLIVLAWLMLPIPNDDIMQKNANNPASFLLFKPCEI